MLLIPLKTQLECSPQYALIRSSILCMYINYVLTVDYLPLHRANLFDDTSLTDASPPTTTLSPPTATKTTPTATSAATHPDNQHTATLDVDHTPTTNRPAPPTVPPAHSIPPSGSGTSNQLPSSTIRPNNRKARAGTAMNAK